MQINDFFASPDIQIDNSINNIGFATGSDGYWNILKKIDIDDCEGLICPGFAQCIDGLNTYSCKHTWHSNSNFTTLLKSTNVNILKIYNTSTYD